MKPSTKAELALNGMAELARRVPAKPMSLAILAENQAISLSYLEQVFAALRRQGLVLSVRGPGGGYLLARSAEAISAGEIIRALDEPETDSAEPTHALNHDSGKTRNFWASMHYQVLELFDGVSLQNILDGDYGKSGSAKETTAQAAE